MFEVLLGDCREMMATLEADSVHAIVTDPPYELGFMGKAWDSTGIAYDPEVWRHALRVLKPGGHLLAFSGSRTYHRMACAIEDAGFEIRDQIMWLYGSGFPKSHDVSKAIDREAGAEREVVGLNQNGRYAKNHFPSSFNVHSLANITAPATLAAREWSGWGTALKPAHEPIVLARKPFNGTVAQNVLAHGTGALNIDGCRVVTDGGTTKSGTPSFVPGVSLNGSSDGSLNGGVVIPINAGRWPANVMHDGSHEVVDGMGPAERFFYCPKASKSDREHGLDGFDVVRTGGMKATEDGSMLTGSGNERTTTRANNHPTVKPTELMRYLCRLVTPEGGIVLDPFTGSGSTGRGAMLEGFRFIGVEMDPGYREIALARIQAAAERRTHGDS